MNKAHWWWLILVVLVLLSYPISAVIMHADDEYERRVIELLIRYPRILEFLGDAKIQHKNNQVVFNYESETLSMEGYILCEKYMNIVAVLPMHFKIEAYLHMFWSFIEYRVRQFWPK